MSKEVAIKADGVFKAFKLPHEKTNSVKSAFLNFIQRKRGYEMQHVLEDVSFEIQKGEFFGIVGRNGSGKSTLLKMLAGIYTPTKGSIAVNGSLTPFIELGVGFNPELTGRENVYLNGALLGFNNKEVEAMYDDIVNFAELERFMDQKLKNYSSGMQVRLAFSIAIRARSDILILDEVLAVGDAAFQQKCYDYFYKLKETGKTVVLVTHDMGAVKQFCTRAMLLSDGKITVLGKPEEVALEYERLNFSANKQTSKEEDVKKIKTLNSDGKQINSFEYGQQIVFSMEMPKGERIGIVGFIVQKNGEEVFATNTLGQKVDFNLPEVKLQITPELGNGTYKVIGGLFGENRFDVKGFVEGPEFVVHGQPDKGERGEEWHGISYIRSEWL